MLVLTADKIRIYNLQKMTIQLFFHKADSPKEVCNCEDS